MRICKRGGCENEVVGDSRVAYCADCPPGQRGTCVDCGKQKSDRQRSPRCKSCARKAMWADTAMREKILAAHKIGMSTPEAKANLSAAQKIAQNRPEVRAKKSAAQKARWADPATRQKRLASRRAKPKLQLVRCARCNRLYPGDLSDCDWCSND